MRNDPLLTRQSITIPSALITDQAVSDGELRVWLVLAAHCKPGENTCIPTIAALADACGKSSRRVTDALSRLENRGYVHREFQPGTETLYHLRHLTVGGATPDKNGMTRGDKSVNAGTAKEAGVRRIYVACPSCGERHSYPFSKAAKARLLSAPDSCPRCGRLMDIKR